MLPYERFTIETHLSMVQIERRLESGVAPPAFRVWSRPTQPFEGSVNGTAFTIRRVIGYRNSFRPRVTGRIVPGRSGMAIECTMTMEPVVQVFMAVWLSFAALGFVVAGIAMLRGSSPGVVPFLFLPFGVAMCTFGFKLEAGKTKRALHELFGVVAV